MSRPCLRYTRLESPEVWLAVGKQPSERCLAPAPRSNRSLPCCRRPPFPDPAHHRAAASARRVDQAPSRSDRQRVCEPRAARPEDTDHNSVALPRVNRCRRPRAVTKSPNFRRSPPPCAPDICQRLPQTSRRASQSADENLFFVSSDTRRARRRGSAPIRLAFHGDLGTFDRALSYRITNAGIRQRSVRLSCLRIEQLRKHISATRIGALTKTTVSGDQQQGCELPGPASARFNPPCSLWLGYWHKPIGNPPRFFFFTSTARAMQPARRITAVEQQDGSPDALCRRLASRCRIG